MATAEPEVDVEPSEAEQPGPEPEAPAPNVLVALTRVMRDLPGIGKGMNADPAQGGYAYRGIEQITGHTQTLFARHGIVMIPEVVEWEREEVTVGGKPWHDEKCQIIYRVYGPGGIDDMIVVGPLYTLGRDGSDKGVNKCMTQALKYALIQMLCIGDKADDADGRTAEAGYRDQQVAEPIDELTAENVRLRLVRIGQILHDYPEEWTRLKLPALKHIDKLPETMLGTALAIIDGTEHTLELSGDVLVPLAEVARSLEEPEPDAGTEEAPGGSDSVPAEEVLPPAEDLTALTDDEVYARIIAAAGESTLLTPLIDLAFDRDLDVSLPAVEAWQAAQSALDEDDLDDSEDDDALDHGGDYG